MSAPRVPDETGLCARECECERCEAGYRPTEEARRVARKAHADAAAARARIEVPGRRPDARLSHTVRPMTPIPPPMSREELAELRADVERFRAGGRK
jgi:hypothetical protein